MMSEDSPNSRDISMISPDDNDNLPPPPQDYQLEPSTSGAAQHSSLHVPSTAAAAAEHLMQHQIINSNLSITQIEGYATMNAEYLRRRYRRKNENPEKIKELLVESSVAVENLRTAVEGKMDVAVIGVLHDLIVSLDGSSPPADNSDPTSIALNQTTKPTIDAGDRQRALFKANICPEIRTVLSTLGGQPAVCEKALLAVAYLCRYSDEYKSSVCLENCKGLGVIDICQLIVGAMKRHKSDRKVMMAACDAIRSMCALESNRERFGNAGACEVTARALVQFASDPELNCWILRAIGHLANCNDTNRDLMGTAGACQSTIMSIQRFPTNANVCTEACWAIRQLAPCEDNRSRFANDFAPESIMAVYKTHFSSEPFAIEACHAMTNLIAGEEDDLIPRIAVAGFTNLALRSIKKCPDSEILARWVYQTLYYISCDKLLGLKLVSSEVLDGLSVSLENHASNENMAEWGCRFVHKLIQFDGASARMRTAGICEMITSAVQRQAISKIVSSVGCQAIGDLAQDTSNQPRLSSAGACEAAVGALKRHHNSVDVALNSCYAIHYLCITQNNVSWMGAYGACEAVTAALIKHTSASEDFAKHGVNALGSLAYKDEGNQMRLNTAGSCEALVNALMTHAASKEVVEYSCRAIFNLCAEPLNVAELGKYKTCSLVVSTMKTHCDEPKVAEQAMLAIHGLAVRVKVDKIHKGNTRKLVESGAIDVCVSVMQKFEAIEGVQGAGGLAFYSLARLEANRAKLGEAGACELVARALQIHLESATVVSKLAMAVDSLSTDSLANKSKFIQLNVTSNLLDALVKHEKNASLVSDCFRALINLSTVEANKKKIFNEITAKLYVKLLKMHEKEKNVALWGCTVIYTASASSETRVQLGAAKACEVVISVLSRHGETDVEIAAWGCKAVVGLSLSDANKERFHNPESCTSIVKVLQSQCKDATVAEWCTAALVSIAVFPQNRSKLGSVGACAAVCSTITHNSGSDAIVRLACEAIYELALDTSNQASLSAAGACDILVNTLTQYSSNATLSAEICRAISSIAMNNSDNASKLVELGVADIIMTGLNCHLFSVPFCQWSCSAVAALCSKSPKSQSIFGALLTMESIARILNQHLSNSQVSMQATRAVRALCFNNADNSAYVGNNTIIIPMALYLIKSQVQTDVIVEHSSWIIGNIEYKKAGGGKAGAEGGEVDLVKDYASLSSRDLYFSPAHWAILADALKTHAKKSNPLRWICAAISMFAERSKLSHPQICDALITLIDRHQENDQVIQKLLFAVGSLARTNKENKSRFAAAKMCEILDGILSGYTEGSAVIFGALPAVVGMAEDSASVQDEFHVLLNVIPSIVKVLFNELENESISRYSCAAISALIHGHARNQAKAGAACNFIADVLTTFKGNPVIALEGTKAISLLAHKSISNRNRLGASDACSAIMISIQPILEDQLRIEWSKPHKTVIYWTVRAISDLAANNPNNQAKLGQHGACEFLVKVLQRASALGSTVDARVISVAFWAIGNLVQIGIDGAKLRTVATESQSRLMSSSISSSSTTPSSSAPKSRRDSMARMTSVVNNVGNVATHIGANIGNVVSAAAMATANAAVATANAATSAATAAAAATASAAVAVTAPKLIKNTTRFLDAGLPEVMNSVMRQFLSSDITILWACRAVNNLARSGKVKVALLDCGLLDTIIGITEKYSARADVLEWANLAKDALMSSSDCESGKLPKSPSETWEKEYVMAP